jgi:hypothetical protein
MIESPIAILERWEAAGGIWRIRSLGDDAAEVELCTCHGEPVDELQSADRALLRYLARRPRSDSR